MQSDRVRTMEPGETKTVKQLMRRCFAPFAWLFIDLGQQVIVFEHDGQIVAGIVLKTFRIDRERRGGTVKWLFTDPDARGLGAAGKLVQAGERWFQQQGCSQVYACVEGHNTASSNRFAGNGYSLLGFREQCARYGRRLLRVWWGAFHLFDVGHFLWAKQLDSPDAAGSDADREPSAGAAAARGSAAAGLTAFTVTLVLQTAILYILTLHWGGRDLLLSLLWQVPAVVVVVFSLRLAVMRLAARSTGMRLEYRGWESGLLLSTVISLFGGGPFPVPGSLYPADREWRYPERIGVLGPIAFAGALSVLLLGWGLRLISQELLLTRAMTDALDLGNLYIRVFLVFEVMLPFFPFACFNGRRVLDWRRQSWAVLVLGTVLLWIAELYL